MRRLATLSVVFVLMLSASGCGVIDLPAEVGLVAVPPRDTAAAFQTDSLSYTLVSSELGLEGKIAFEFTNPTAAPVYIVNCNGATSLRLEKQSGDKWVLAWAPVIPLCLSPPIVVQPGERYSGVVHVVAGHPGSSVYPKFDVDPIPGVYRLVWDEVLSTYDDQVYPFGEALPEEQRVSNRFHLSVASQ